MLTEPGLATKSLRDTGKSQEENRICSEYIERERNYNNEKVKTVERRKVLDFFSAHSSPTPDDCLLSLPCIHWKFEHLFLDFSPDSRFVGLEWTWGVIELGRPFIPKLTQRSGKPWVGTGKEIHIDYSLAIGEFTVYKLPRVRWVWVHAGSFLSIRRHDIRDDKRRAFGQNYRSNTHVWLDFTSPLCEETKSALNGLGSFLDLRVISVPVAITIMAARDEYKSNEDRVRAVFVALNQRGHRFFDLKTWWSYTHHGIPMLTVCGNMLKGALSEEQMMRLHCQELGLSDLEADSVFDEMQSVSK